MAISKVVFVSEVDGSVFETEAEVLAYDSGLKNKAQIDAFLDQHFPLLASKTRAGAVKTKKDGSPKLLATADRKFAGEVLAKFLAGAPAAAEA